MTIERENEFDRYLRLRWMRGDADRFMRPDAARFMRPDWERFVRPDWERFVRPEFLEHMRVEARARANAHDAQQEMSEAEWLDFQREIASLRADLAMLRQAVRAQKALHHSNFQPRVPAGNPDGGEWTREGGQRVQVAQRGNKLPGISAPGGAAGGHHYVPQGVYTKYPLSDEALRVFRTTTSGRLETQAIGSLRGHFWDGPNGAHKAYNDAVKELFDGYLAANSIQPERMTAEQARSFLRQIELSENPRIRDYNNMIKLLRMLRIFRGRGNE